MINQKKYESQMQQRKPIKPQILQPTNTQQTNLSKTPTFKLILISMATLFSFTILLLHLFSSATTTSGHRHRHLQSSVIQNVCKASQDPISCQSSLSQSSPSTVIDAIESAISVSSTNLQKGRVLVQSVLSHFKGDKNGTEAANNCLELLRYSEYRINLVKDSAIPKNSMKDARAWMSSALVYQYDSWSALKYVNSTKLVGETMSFLNGSLIVSTSNALGMLMNVDVFGDKVELWGVPKTERDGFWERGTGSNEAVIGGVPEGLKVDVTVCKTGCDYMSVQAGVDATPENLEGGKRFVIGIKAGVYEETVRVPLEKRNVVFLGDGIGKTVITGSANVGMQGMTTYNTATLGVIGDGFMASGLTIQNTAGPEAHQAVAFRSDSDLSIVENCEFLSNQDTLYAHSLRQYYKSCRIQGNVDFIFGNSAAFFQDCQILIAPRQLNPEKGETNAVTAHGRIDPGQMSGFVFQNCLINGTDAYMALYYSKPKAHKNFLGRPWKPYSRTVFVKCILEALISPGGWLPWSGDVGLSTLYYGEFLNSGAGSKVTARVPWSSQIPAEHIESYSVQNFIQGNQWIRNSS